MKSCIVFGFFFFLSSPLIGSTNSILLTENLLWQIAQKGSPSFDQIESAMHSVLIRTHEENEKYGTELFGKGSYTETNERALIEFAPIFSPIKQMQVGVRKNFERGFNLEAAVVADQRSLNSGALGKIENATTTTLMFTVQMDIWKNLFGRLDRAKLESLKLEGEKAQLEKKIEEKTFHLSLRRIYWSLVANEMSLKISHELLKTSKQQAADTQRRFRASVAEADEVARYNAQVAGREATITNLKYQKELYITQLKNLLPELSEKDLSLGEVDLNQTISDVLSCTTYVSGQATVPYQNTKYDELISMLQKTQKQSALANDRYADMDVKLFGTVRSTGVSLKDEAPGQTPPFYRGTYGGTFDDMTASNRTGYEVGIQFNMPLGNTKDNTQRSKQIYDEKRLQYSITSTNAKMANTHREFIKTTKLLNEIMASQKITTVELEKRLKGMRRKYEQARVSVNEMIMDQDALLESELSTINIQLQILNTIFDYLVIFQDTPCGLNRN